MIKKVWHVLVALWSGFLLSAILVGGVLSGLGLVAGPLVTPIVCVLTPFVGGLCYWGFYVYDGRTEEARREARRERSRYHPEREL